MGSFNFLLTSFKRKARGLTNLFPAITYYILATPALFGGVPEAFRRAIMVGSSTRARLIVFVRGIELHCCSIDGP